MATISKTADYLRIKNPRLNKGDYAIVVDSTGVPTGITKAGTGKYYNDTPESTVTVDNTTGKNIGVSAGSLPSSGQVLTPITITGAIDGSNTIYTCSAIPTWINANTSMLSVGNGFTITNPTAFEITLDLPIYTGQKLSAWK